MGKVATSLLPLPPRGFHRLLSGGQNQKWPTSEHCGYITPAAWGSPPLQSEGQNQKWPINGQGGYIAPAASGIPTASKRGAKSEVAHKWARGKVATSLQPPGDPHGFKGGEVAHHPLPPRGSPPLPHRFKAGGKIRSGPYMGKVAT